MEPSNDRIAHRQLMAAVFIGLFSPAIRLLPRGAVQLGSTASWLSPIAAAAPLALFLWMLSAMMKNRGKYEGLTGVFMRALGRVTGKALAAVYGLWLVFYSGFLLRTGGERLLSSVYANGSAAFFMVVTLALAVIVAMGAVRSMARAAEAFVLIISVALALVLIFALADMRPENLLPVSYLDTGRILLGAVPFVNVMSVAAYFLFLQGYVEKRTEGLGVALKWQGMLLFVLLVVMVTTIGMLSSTIIANLQNPFFIMIRDITIFDTIERIESVVITLWVITDFMCLGALLMISSEIFGVITGLGRKKLCVLALAAAVLACGLVVTPTAFDMRLLSEKVVPGIHMLLVFIILPAVFVIGKLRKRL